jgi:hypothetical protein
MSSFDEVRQKLEQMTSASRILFMNSAERFWCDATMLLTREPEQREPCPYVLKTDSLVIYLIICQRLGQYGVNVREAVKFVDIDRRPITKLRLHHSTAYCFYEYDQAIKNQEAAKLGVELWKKFIGKDPNPTSQQLGLYARRYVSVCMPPTRWRVEISYNDADGVDDAEELKDKLEKVALEPKPVIPPNEY